MSEESAALRPADLSELMRELAKKRGRPVLLINRDMDWWCVGEVRRIAYELGAADGLAIVLNSPGGDIEAAYRMILALRYEIANIETLVTGWAKSAATFFCLGADSIHMGRYGELGPLDPQIPDRRGSAIPVSSLETFKSIEHLLDYSMDSLDAIIQQLLSGSDMDFPHAIEQAPPLFAAISTPLYNHVDPHELGQSGRLLAASQEYAMRVMRRWAYADLPEEARRMIARRLVWDYPTHGFVIDLTEAQEIGLNAEKMDEESDMICRKILSMSGDSVGIQRTDEPNLGA